MLSFQKEEKKNVGFDQNKRKTTEKVCLFLATSITIGCKDIVGTYLVLPSSLF